MQYTQQICSTFHLKGVKMADTNTIKWNKLQKHLVVEWSSILYWWVIINDNKP